MISPPERAFLIAHARESIDRGSRSFRLSSRLFDRRTRERAWLLYAWCRACDDLLDGQLHGLGARTVADPERRLRYIVTQTEQALAGRRSMDPPFDGLRVLAAECALPRRLVEDHLAGFALDAQGWGPATEQDLLSYCYHVAGAVGCMMAIVMGVPADEEDVLDRASDLGIAFQLANIARDIVEDASVGRCYLPAQWLEEAGLRRETLMAPALRAELATLAQRLCALSRRYEDSARIGAQHLPFRSRWAVLAAARIYGAIARKVGERGVLALDSRTFVPRSEKLIHVVAAALEAVGRRRSAGRSGLWTRSR